jgi:hypothetical protein
MLHKYEILMTITKIMEMINIAVKLEFDPLTNNIMRRITEVVNTPS